MPLADPSLERVSACPVHFIWDGRGNGRVLVRSGFLGFLAAGMLATAGRLAHVEPALTSAVGVAAVAAGAWLVGQGISWLTARRLEVAR